MLDCYDKDRVLRELISTEDRKRLLECIGTKYSEVMASGGLGVPMDEYRNGDISIRVRFYNGWGAKYMDFCTNCCIFPCPSGVYCVQILVNGEISLCRFRRSIKFNFFDCKDENEIHIKLKSMLDGVIDEEREIKQIKTVFFGTEEFIGTPESNHGHQAQPPTRLHQLGWWSGIAPSRGLLRFRLKAV